jgi:hypothetical protein
MAQPLIIDLGFVIDRDGEKIAATMHTQEWNGQAECVVALGEPNQPNAPFPLHILFDYTLRDGLKDFEILSDTMLTVPRRIPAGEMRSLMRRVMSQSAVGVLALPLIVYPPSKAEDITSPDDFAWLSDHPDFAELDETAPAGVRLQ